MNSKAPRIIVAVVALVSLAGMAAPADAATSKPQLRTVWCC